MALLAMGSLGPEVKALQGSLNKLLTLAPLLKLDGIFGPRTKTKVQQFQGFAGVAPDGVVGDETAQAIIDFLGRLIPTPPAPTPAVRLITSDIVGDFPSIDNLIVQVIPSISTIDTVTFRPGQASNVLGFSFIPPTVGRLAIFACAKNGVERAVILLLPATTKPDRLAICITQGFAQASKTLNPLHWENPLSPELIKFCLLKHVVNRFGAEALASRKNIGLLYIVRAKGKELGPFASDGPFLRQCLTEMADLTNGAFSLDEFEAFTFSSGVSDFNPWLAAVQSQVNIMAVYNIDPAGAMDCATPPGAVRKQYLSGQTGGFPGGVVKHGFEPLVLGRWKNEFRFGELKAMGAFNYLHNYTMPAYVLNLALNT